MSGISGMLKIVLSVLVFFCAELSAYQDRTHVLVDFFGTEGNDPGMMLSPKGITVDVSGNIYVADTGNNRIQKFSASGELMKHYGGFGWEEDQFDAPVSISAAGLDIFVTDRNNHRIMRFDRDLNYISGIFFDQLTGPGERFQFPAAGTVSKMMDKFVIDSENKHIVKFNAFDKPETVFGGYASTGQPLNTPTEIAVSGSEKVYVSDPGLSGIAVFDYFGNFITLYGEKDLDSPGGLCVDDSGNIYVIDESSNRIVLFDGRGRKTGEITHERFTELSDLSYTNHRLYVLDRAAAKVYIFLVED